MKFRSSTFQEFSPDSPDEAYAVDACRLTRVYDVVNPSPGAPGARLPVTLAVRRQFVEDMVGANVVINNGSGLGTYISRQVPYQAPAVPTSFLRQAGATVTIGHYIATAIPSSQLLHVKVNDPSANVLGQGQGGAAAGPFWRTRVFFDAVNWGVLTDASVLAQAAPIGGTVSPLLAGPFPDEGDALRRGFAETRYITRWADYAGRIISLSDPSSGQALMNTVDPLDSPVVRPIVNTAVPFPEPSLIVYYQWRAVPLAGVPQAAIQNLLSNSVNECDFDGWRAGCLSLQTAKERIYLSPLGDVLKDMTYAFKFLPHRRRLDGVYLGWNSILHRRSGAAGTLANTIDYARMDAVGAGLGSPPFVPADYCALFRPDQT